MINVRKGTALSLQQTDRTARIKTGEGIVAGMLVRVDPTNIATIPEGEAIKVTTAAVLATDPYVMGFALTNQTDGDAIESSKIGIYLLDGGSVVETDQFTGTITSADIGKFVLNSTATAGKVMVAATPGTGKTIGVLTDVRTIPGVTVPAVAGTTPNWETITVLSIKLAAN